VGFKKLPKLNDDDRRKIAQYGHPDAYSASKNVKFREDDIFFAYIGKESQKNQKFASSTYRKNSSE
jgi:hypothetical protein